MKYGPALEIANHLVLSLRNECEWIEIAGSLRRKKAEVGDIELCAVPKESGLMELSYFIEGEPIKNGHRYKQIRLPYGINLDLFIVLPPAQWGVIYTLRTGPEDFSTWVVTKRQKGGRLPSDCEMHDGGVYRNGELISMPEEMDFLNFLGLGWIEPFERGVNRCF